MKKKSTIKNELKYYKRNCKKKKISKCDWYWENVIKLRKTYKIAIDQIAPSIDLQSKAE